MWGLDVVLNGGGLGAVLASLQCEVAPSQFQKLAQKLAETEGCIFRNKGMRCAKKVGG
jgi:hypothetical protein